MKYLWCALLALAFGLNALSAQAEDDPVKEMQDVLKTFLVPPPADVGKSPTPAYEELQPEPIASTGDPVADAINRINQEVVRANVRIDSLDRGFSDLAKRVEMIETKQLASFDRLEQLEASQRLRAEQFLALKTAAIGAEQRADAASSKAEIAVKEVGLAKQETAQAKAAAQQAWAHAQAADNAARPHGPVGKILGAIFPGFLGHR